MPEVLYSTSVNAPQDAIWDFVKDMSNWAPFVTGYQSHEVIDESESIWTLKGDVGVLSRIVQFRVRITEWNGPSRVTFVLDAVSEQTSGQGLFTIKKGDPASPIQHQAKPHWWRRLRQALLISLYRRRSPATLRRGNQAIAPQACLLTFQLKLASRGVIGPVVDAMMQPLLAPAAEDLANAIANRVEAMQLGVAPAPE